MLMSGESLDHRPPVKLNVKIRRPRWAVDDLRLTVNGKPYLYTAGPGEYISIERLWEKGDNIDLLFPMKLRTEAMPDDPNKVAFFYGPTLLAGALGKEGIEHIDLHAEERAKYDQVPSPPIPVIVTDGRAVEEYIRPASDPGEFIIPRSVLRLFEAEAIKDIALKPFYKMHYQRYIVYWDIVPANGPMLQ